MVHSPCVRARRPGVLLHTSSRHNHALQGSSSLPAVPAVGVTVVVSPVPMMVPIISAVMVMMSPVPRTVSNIPVVPGSHDDGRGIHDRQWWGDEHGYGSDKNRGRQPNAHGDMDPRMYGER